MDKYLNEILGRKTAKEVERAVKTGTPILITGEEKTGKTTLCNYIKSIGGNAVEDFEVFKITLKKNSRHDSACEVSIPQNKERDEYDI